jgi:hypothetical protein
MTNPFRACAGVWGGRADHDANIGSTFTPRPAAVMLVTGSSAHPQAVRIGARGARLISNKRMPDQQFQETDRAFKLYRQRLRCLDTTVFKTAPSGRIAAANQYCALGR